MHKCFKYTSVVFLVFVSLLQACGGGGSGGNVPTSADQSSGVTNGVVSGFGSVLVDGNEIEDAKASVVAENADGTFSNTVLQLGQRVRVDHDGKGTASKVTVDATLIGTVSLVNATDQTIKVAGQVAGINSDLSKGALTVWAGGYNSFSDLAVNDIAQIHGSLMYDSTSRAYKVTATRIQKMASMASLKVSGKITDINTTTKTFKLNELTVDYTNSTVRPAAVTLVNGMLVTAFALPSDLSGNRLTPDHLKINRTQDGSDKGAATQTGGLVSMYDASGKTFELQGVKVVFTENTKFTPSASALNNNAYVAVSGTFSAEGLLKATSIQIRQQNNSTDLAKVKLIGPISQFVDSSSFVVRGVPVDASFSQQQLEVAGRHLFPLQQCRPQPRLFHLKFRHPYIVGWRFWWLGLCAIHGVCQTQPGQLTPTHHHLSARVFANAQLRAGQNHKGRLEKSVE